MTEVAPEAIREFDDCLAFLEGSFSELEEWDREWGELSDEEKDDFLGEWPIVEDRIDDLAELVERHGVPMGRSGPYDRLMSRIARDRLILEVLQRRP